MKVTFAPLHIVVALALTCIVGAVNGFTVIAMPVLVTVGVLAHAALLVITTLTRSLLFNVVVVNVALLVPWLLPFTFHWYVGVAPPLTGVAVKVTLAPAHIVVALALMLTLGVTLGVTVIVTELDVALVEVAHAALLVNTTLTISPLANVVVVKVALLVPWLLPFTFHWYAGVPPLLVAVAVKLTLVPAHIVVLGVDIDTVGVTAAPTVMVTALDVAVVDDAQAALLVNTTVTTSPLLSVELANVALLVPWLLPFTFH